MKIPRRRAETYGSAAYGPANESTAFPGNGTSKTSIPNSQTKKYRRRKEENGDGITDVSKEECTN
jgi:hypothetical protein